MAVGTELLEDVFRDVGGVGGWGGGFFVPAEGEGDLLGFVEADHYVARVEIGMDEIVDEEHVQEGVETFIGDFLLEDPAAVFEEGSEGDALGEFLNQDLASGVGGVGVREPSCGPVFELLAEHGQVGGFDPEVELEAHHFTELKDFVRKRQPFHCRNRVDDVGKDGHDLKVTANDPFDFGVEDFNGHIARRYSRRGAFDEDVDVLAHPLPEIGWIRVHVVVALHCNVGLELCFVDLGDSSDAQWLLLELIEDLVELPSIEGFDNGSLGCGQGVGGSIRMERGHAIAHFLREDVCSRRCPLSELGAVSDWVRLAFNSTHLDECWTGPLHRGDQKVVPPQGTRPFLVAILHPPPEPYDWDGADDGQEDDGQMEESKASCDGLVDV